MCGIAGYFCNHSDGKDNIAILEKMNDLLVQRGPYGAGLFTDGPVGLAHCRLAILDLSERASQPMSNEDGSVWMVVNGEFYNYKVNKGGHSCRKCLTFNIQYKNYRLCQG